MFEVGDIIRDDAGPGGMGLNIVALLGTHDGPKCLGVVVTNGTRRLHERESVRQRKEQTAIFITAPMIELATATAGKSDGRTPQHVTTLNWRTG